MNKKREKGVTSYIALLIIFSLVSTFLTYVYKHYKLSSYEQEASNIAEEIILLSAKINDSMNHENDCRKINNRYLLDNGYLISGFEKSLNSNNDSAITFKYGEIVVSSGLSGDLLPPEGGLTQYDGYRITLTNYRWNNIPLMIDSLIDHFDIVRWVGQIVDKDKNRDAYFQLLNQTSNENGERNNSLDFITWGC